MPESHRTSTFIMMKKVLFLFAMLTCIFASCSDGGSEDPINPTPKPDDIKYEITIDASIISNGLSFDMKGGEGSISFTTNADWTLTVASTTSGATWCKASATSGTKGSATVKFTVEENTGYEDRSVSVTIKAGTASKTFTITQKAVDALLVTTGTYEVMQEGGTIEVEVKANIDYSMEISETAKGWISEASSRALKTYKHTFNIASNEEADNREGEITFKSGDKVETVKVYQAGGAIIMLTQDEYIVSDAGEMITVEIKSNIEFGVQMPDVDWIVDEASSRGMSSHTLNYYIEPNEGYDSRSAEIIFFDKNSNLQDTLKVIQAQKDAIVISQKIYDVKAEGETIEVKLSSNVEFEVTMPDVDWIEQVSSRALKEHTLYFKVAENEGEDSRSAEIVFVNKESELSETITISQDCKSLLAIAQDEYNVDDAGETISVAIRNNVEYAIQMPDVDWITEATASRSVSTDTLKFVIAANEEYDSRSAEIIFFDKNSDLKDTLKVTQAQKDAIVISQKTFDINAEGETIEVKLSANVDFEITMPDVDWVKQVSSRALKEHTLYFEVAKNESKEKRKAEIILKDKNSQLSDKLIINQYEFLEEGYTNGVVTVATAGTMKKLLGDDCLNITSLKIKGFINGDDVYYLRRMLGGDNFDKADWGKLTALDLSEAKIVEGGGYYNIAVLPGQREECYTSNDHIGWYMFHKCYNLQKIILPDNIKSINGDSFSNCDNLESVSIGGDVLDIGYNSFYCCEALKSVYITDLADWCNIDFDNFPANPLNNGARLYLNNKEVTELIIPDEVVEIKEAAFYGCMSIEHVAIGNNVKSIGEWAFSECTSLNSVHINSLASWCQINFKGGAANPLSNGAKLYLNNEELTELTIPEELTEIKDYTFGGCKSLIKVNLGSKIASIGNSTFGGCNSLVNIIIHENVTKIGDFAFSGCALTTLDIHDGVTSIGVGAFKGCNKLTSVVVGDGVTSIAGSTFKDCYSLESVKIGKNVKSIGISAFENASISEFYSFSTTPPNLQGQTDWYVGLIHPFNYAIQKEAVLYVPVRCVDAYKSSSWGNTLYGYNYEVVLFKNIKEMD